MIIDRSIKISGKDRVKMDKGEIKIAGNGVIGEGEYSKVKVMGSAKSTGHVVADEIQIMGNANFDGNVEGGTCTIHGNAHIVGDVAIVKLKVNGDLYVEGDCKVQELIVNGKVEISGLVEGKNVVTRGGLILNKPFKAKTLKIYGELRTPTDVSVEEVIVEGKIQCEGLLSAESITVHSCAHSYCKEIGATKIVVEKPIYHLLWLSYHKKNVFTCETMEADEMKLENVEAKVARGRNIDLVDHCDIHTVEYSKSFSKSENSVVRDLVKVD